MKMSSGIGNGKGLNGGQNVTALTTAIPAASMRNLPPGAQINQLLLNKNKHLQANNGFGNLSPSSAPLLNGNVGNVSSSPFSGSGSSDGGMIKTESPARTALPPAVTALQNGNSSVGDSASETGSVMSDPTRREPSTSSSTSPSKSSEYSDGSKSGPGWVQPPYRPSSTAVLRYTNQLDYIKNKMIKAMLKHTHSWPFRVPVDTIKLNILDYHDIIKNPMDLGTISKRLDYYWYSNAVQCIQDFKVMFTNCYTYNQAGEDVVKMANELEKVFLAKLGQLPSEEVEIPVKLRPGKAKRGPGRPAGSGNKKTTIGFSLPTKTTTLSASSSLSASSTTSSTSPVTGAVVPPGVVHSANRAPVRPPSLPQPFKTVEIPSTIPVIHSTTKPKGLPPAPARTALPPAMTKTPTFQPQASPAAPPKTVTVPTVKVEKLSPVKKKPGEVLKEQMAYCYALLKEMRGKKHEAYAWPFYEPVDAMALGLTDYHQKIKKPMDMRTMMTRFDQGLYHTPQQFADDLRLIFFNCYRYNPKDTKLLNMAWKLQDFFETRWAKLPYDLPCTPRMVREQQSLMLYAPNDANAPTEEELGRESDRSPTPRASTSSKDSPLARRKKEPMASTSKNASAPGAVADLQAQLAALQAQVKVIAAEKATHVPGGDMGNVALPPVTSLPFPSQVRGRKPAKKPEAPSSSILATLMDHDGKKGTSTPPAAARSPKSKTVKRTTSQVDDEEPSSSSPPPKKPRKPRTPKEKAQIPPPNVVEKVPEKTASPATKVPVAVATPSHIATPVSAAPSSGTVSGMTTTSLSPKRGFVGAPPANTKVREMSYEEKQQLSISINELTPENLEKVVQIIQSMEPQYAEAPEELEIDFEMLRPVTLCALEDFINETKGIKKSHHHTGVPGNVPHSSAMSQASFLPSSVVSLSQPPTHAKEKSPKGSHSKGGSSKKANAGKAYSQASTSGSSSSDSDSTDSESEVEGDVLKKAGSQVMPSSSLGTTVGPSVASSQAPVFGAAPRMASVFPPVLTPTVLTSQPSLGLAGLSAVAQQAAQDLTASKGSLFGLKNAPKEPQPQSPPAAPALKNWGSAFGKGASLASGGGGSSTTVFNESFEQFRKQAKEKEEKQKLLRMAETEKRQQRETEQREKAKKERAQASERDQELELEKARRAHFEGGVSMPSNGFGFHNRDRIQALQSTSSPNAAYQASPTSSMSPASSIPLSPASQVASPPEASANPQSERDKQRQREAERRRRAATAGRIDLTHQHDLMSTFEHQMY